MLENPAVENPHLDVQFFVCMNRTSGEVHFNGEDILKKNRKEMRKLREEMQIIFQDPYSSLNPRMNVYNILSEPLVAHGYYKKVTS